MHKEVIGNSEDLVLCCRDRVPEDSPGKAIGESSHKLQQETQHFGDASAKGWSTKNSSSRGASKLQSIRIIILLLICDLGDEQERKGYGLTVIYVCVKLSRGHGSSSQQY